MRNYGFAVVNFPYADFETLANDAVTSLSVQIQSQSSADKRTVEEAWSELDPVKDIACNESILNLLRVVYARKPFPFSTLNAEASINGQIHCDALGFASRPDNYMCGVWLALEDMKERDASLSVYPGSHRWPRYYSDQLAIDFAQREDTSLASDYRDLLIDLVKAHDVKPMPIRLKKGQCVIYSGSLVFAGAEPDAKGTSWRQRTQYYFEDCVYWNPEASDVGMGQLEYRRPRNIISGERVNGTYMSRQVSV